ncbi:M50 family metallopeptidase [Bacillus taeanensis]|uniref:M50 family metallopeptidase n=1 Tax=Bacillus taeanensis TaxID=273032 RepID=UPI002482ECCC|nr:M50 family metallopeptidase [Bacillus taeanensis]
MILALIVLRVPFIGKYLKVVNTLVHEVVGHGLMSMLTDGKINRVMLFSNTEGLAFTSYRSWFGKVLTAAAGYPLASITAFFFFYLYSLGNYQWIVYILIGITAMSLLFWVRNLYGIYWLVAFGGMLYVIYQHITHPYARYAVLFIISVQMIESVYSSFTIFYLSIKRKNDAGDAAALAASTHIPAACWGLLFLMQSLYFAYLALTTMI